MKQPRQYSRRILLVSTGTSPQVLTETFYELVNQGFIPTEVHLISTSIGAEKANKLLLEVQENKSESVYVELCKQLRITPPRFDKSCIHTIADASGQELEDIKSEKDNQAAADFIVNKVREFTLDEDSALHVSIAGGRKTMGYYTGYALSLYGRMQDRLSHVLVSEGFENNPCFYFPTNKKIKAKPFDKACKEELDASQAEILLADIPFVPMREELPDQLKEGRASFNRSIELIRRANQDTNLIIDLPKQRVISCGEFVELPIARLAYLLMFAFEVKNPSEYGLKIPAQKETDFDATLAYLNSIFLSANIHADSLLHDEMKTSELSREWKIRRDIIQDMDIVDAKTFKVFHENIHDQAKQLKGSFFSQRRSDLKQDLEVFLSKKHSEKLLPTSTSGVHKLKIPAENITIIYHDGTKA